MSEPTQDDMAAVEKCADAFKRINAELSKVIVGQTEVIEQVLTAMLARNIALGTVEP